MMLSSYSGVRIAAAVTVFCELLVSGSPRRTSGHGGTAGPRTVLADVPETVHPFLTSTFEYHTDKESGGVRLDQFKDKRARPRLPYRRKGSGRARKRAIPPETNSTRRRRTQTGPGLAGSLCRAHRAEGCQFRSHPVQRLDRAEYNSLVHDLLVSRLSAGQRLPRGRHRATGSTTSRGTLSVSPVLIEKYLAAAEKVAGPQCSGSR